MFKCIIVLVLFYFKYLKIILCIQTHTYELTYKSKYMITIQMKYTTLKHTVCV